MRPTNADIAFDTGAAWDAIYDTSDGQPSLPPPPESPRHRRMRRRVLWSLMAALFTLATLTAIGYLLTRTSAAMLRAIGVGDADYLETHVDWPTLQSQLHDDLAGIVRHGELATTPRPVATQAYLDRLIAGMVASTRQPPTLARVLQDRVFPGDMHKTDIAPRAVGDELGSFHLLGTDALRLDFADSDYVVPSGVSLCLRPFAGPMLGEQLFQIGWPETGRHC